MLLRAGAGASNLFDNDLVDPEITTATEFVSAFPNTHFERVPMKGFRFPSIVISLALFAYGTLQAKDRAPTPADSQEPQEIFSLKVDGSKAGGVGADDKSLSIEMGKPFDVAALAGSKTATLAREPHRIFQLSGIRFHYPREYVFEADLEDADLWQWTLDGDDAMIMIQSYVIDETPAVAISQLKQGLKAVYTGKRVEESPVVLKLKDTELKGTSLDVHGADLPLRQDLYSFRSGKEVIILILQDLPQEDGSPSADCTRMTKMMRETLELPKK